MLSLVELLTSLGPSLLLGGTLLLGIGVVCVAFVRAPVYQQRLGEISIVATLVWLVLACLPMSRLDLAYWDAATAVSIPPRHEPRDSRATQQTSPSRTLHDEKISGLDQDSVDTPGDQSTARVEFASGQGPTFPVDKPGAANRSSVAFNSAEGHPVLLFGRLALARLYLCGALFCVLWLALGGVLLWRVERAAEDPPEWLRDLYESAGVGKRARLLISRRTRGPFSYGLFRPTIVLSKEICCRENTGPLRHVLLHEQVHVQRRDAWGHIALNFAFPVLYMHPMYWWVRARVQFARELIADDQAAAHGPRSLYAEQLLRLVGGRRTSLIGSLGIMGVFNLRNPLTRRMKMLLEREGRLSAGMSWVWASLAAGGALLLVVGLASVIGLRVVAADEERTKPSNSGLLLPGSVPAATTPSAPEQVTRDKNVAPSISSELGGAARENVLAQAGGNVPLQGPRQFVATQNRQPGAAPHIDNCRIVAEQLMISTQVDGIIRTIEVTAGTVVAKGQLLATIEDDVARLQAEAASRDAEASSYRAGNDIDVRFAKKASEFSGQAVKQAQQLGANRAISSFEVQRRRNSLDRALLQVEQAERDFAVSQTDSKKRLLEARAVEALLARHQIRSPKAGTITEIPRTAGEWVRRGEPICRIVSMNRVRVECFVSAERFNPEELSGRDVTIEVRRARGEIVRTRGKIAFVSPVVEDGGFRVSADVDNPTTNRGSYALNPGMRAKMILDGTEATHEADAGGVNSVHEKEPGYYSKEEMGYLEELLQAYTGNYGRVKALYEAGAPGGEAENEASSRHQLCLVRARLALAQGNVEECLRQYVAGVAAAEKQVISFQAAYDAGTATLDVLLKAQAQRAETKLKLSQIKKRFANRKND